MKKLLTFLLILLPFYSSAEWHPKYWYIYADLNGGISTVGRKTFSVSANVSCNKFYAGLNGLIAVNGWPYLKEYDVVLGRLFGIGKKTYSILCTGGGLVNFVRLNNGYYSDENTFSIPLIAKLYYVPFKHLAAHAQLFYNLNKIERYGGMMAGVSLGLFNWTNAKYHLPPQR